MLTQDDLQRALDNTPDYEIQHYYHIHERFGTGENPWKDMMIERGLLKEEAKLELVKSEDRQKDRN